jgi:hypothetical protein
VATGNYCMMTGARGAGAPCPVHGTTECLVRGWLTEVPPPGPRGLTGRLWALLRGRGA